MFSVFCREAVPLRSAPLLLRSLKVHRPSMEVSDKKSHLDHAVSSKTSHKNNVPPNALRTRPYWGSKKIEKVGTQQKLMSFSKVRGQCVAHPCCRVSPSLGCLKRIKLNSKSIKASHGSLSQCAGGKASQGPN